MQHDLYFIEHIRDALAEPDNPQRLVKAFQEIEHTRTEMAYRKGYQQFEAFMTEVTQHIELPKTESGGNKPYPFSLTLQCDKHLIAEIDISERPLQKTISNLNPGSYQLSLSTGRVVWEEELTVEQLSTLKAKPGIPLDMAADTGTLDVPPTLRILVTITLPTDAWM